MKATETNMSGVAMLAHVQISSWSARKLAPGLAKQLNASGAASSDATLVHKRLIPDGTLKAIKFAQGSIRTFHAANTFAWIDRGPRILPSANFFEWQSGMQVRISEFEKARGDLVNTYPAIYNQEAARMGAFFDAYDYPTPDELPHRYSVRTQIMPLPTDGDFRCQLPAEAADKIRKEIAASLVDVSAQCRIALLDRIEHILSRVINRMAAYVPASKTQQAQGSFSNRLIDKVAALASLLPRLNIGGCPVIAAAAVAMADIGKNYTVDTLRQDVGLRLLLSEDCRVVIAQIQMGK